MLAASIGLGGCLYDPDHRCGPAMTFSEATLTCVCDANAIPATGGCKRCADDEVATGGKCGCAYGQIKNADDVCVTTTGLGAPCDTMTAPCGDATYSRCVVKGTGTRGTCTNSCSTNNDCSATYTCATWETSPYCRTFEGAGTRCSSAADCTGDAKYCDTFMTHVCLVSGCSLSAQDCPRGTRCCDFSRFGAGTLCAGGCPP